MKKTRFSETKIVSILKKQEAGIPTADICREYGISQATFYNWKAKYGGLEVKAVITEAAWAATRTKDTFYSARYHWLAAGRGKKRVLVAVGHSMLKSVYHVLSQEKEYRELDASYVNKRQNKSVNIT